MDTKHFEARIEIIKRFRTQEHFALAAGIPEAAVSKILRGTKRPTDKERERFSLLLEIPAEQLFGDEQHGQQAR